eukprot:13169574-Ditylum_brightwellii.AAC.1
MEKEMIKAAIAGLTGDSLDDNESSNEPERVKKTGKRKKFAISSSVKAKVGKSSLCGIIKKAKWRRTSEGALHQ